MTTVSDISCGMVVGTRQLISSYDGPLCQVTRHDGEKHDFYANERGQLDLVEVAAWLGGPLASAAGIVYYNQVPLGH